MKLFLWPTLLIMIVACGRQAPDRHIDSRELILQARDLAELYADVVWPGFSDAPFGVLLVGADTEQLFCHPGSPQGFRSTGIDPVSSCSSGVRTATFHPNIPASFPAVGGKATIVIGTPEGTAKTPDEWVLTILHEHFHQMQFSWPGYYSGTSEHKLSGGDETGMWMPNYPLLVTTVFTRAPTSKASRRIFAKQECERSAIAWCQSIATAITSGLRNPGTVILIAYAAYANVKEVSLSV